MHLHTRLTSRLQQYGGNYTTYVRTKSENETNQMKAYHKQQEEIAHSAFDALSAAPHTLILFHQSKSLLQALVLMPTW